MSVGTDHLTPMMAGLQILVAWLQIPAERRGFMVKVIGAVSLVVSLIATVKGNLVSPPYRLSLLMSSVKI